MPGQLIEHRPAPTSSHITAGRYIQIIALTGLRIAAIARGRPTQAGQTAQAQHAGIGAGTESGAQECSCKGKNLQMRNTTVSIYGHSTQHSTSVVCDNFNNYNFGFIYLWRGQLDFSGFGFGFKRVFYLYLFIFFFFGFSWFSFIFYFGLITMIPVRVRKKSTKKENIQNCTNTIWIYKIIVYILFV